MLGCKTLQTLENTYNPVKFTNFVLFHNTRKSNTTMRKCGAAFPVRQTKVYKFANSTGLYFSHFITFCRQASQF